MTTKLKAKHKQANRKTQRLVKSIVTLAVVVLVVVGVYFVLNELVAGRPGYGVPDLGGGHTPACTPQYNSRPPTSGCHDPSVLPYGIHETAADDKLQTHNLEHGGINIQYRPSGIPSEDDRLVQSLSGLVNRLRNQDSKYCRLLVAPYAVGFSVPTVEEFRTTANAKKIALTAWNRVDLLDEFDEKRITDFINAFINQGPERNVPDCSS